MKMRRTPLAQFISTILLLCTAGASFAQQPQQAVAAKRGTFNWVHVAPYHRSLILEKIRQGTAFSVVGKSGHYYAVILADGVHGWLHEHNVRFQ